MFGTARSHTSSTKTSGVSDRIVAYNLYTDPPLGRVGMTEAEVRKSSKPALIGTMAIENVSRALEKGETRVS
jgi:pyruvate/2-oxoglutarate dehydrogenase complex dihydrolipoamide dehydrogenase (E3) component